MGDNGKENGNDYIIICTTADPLTRSCDQGYSTIGRQDARQQDNHQHSLAWQGTSSIQVRNRQYGNISLQASEPIRPGEVFPKAVKACILSWSNWMTKSLVKNAVHFQIDKS